MERLPNLRFVARTPAGDIKFFAVPSDGGLAWRWLTADIRTILNVQGLEFGLTPDFSDDSTDPQWPVLVASADVVTPRGAGTQVTMAKYGTRLLERFVAIARTNRQQIRFSTGFWNATDLTPDIANESNPAKVEAFMRARLHTMLALGPDRFDIVLEPFDPKGDVRTDTPYYRAWGSDWIVQAFRFAEEEAGLLGLTPGKDVKFFWNDFRLDQPGTKVDATIAYIKKIHQQGIHIDGIGLQIYPGVSFYPHVPDKRQLKSIITRFGELGAVYVEYETWASQDNPQVEPIAEAVFDACIEANSEAGRALCSTVGFWETTSRLSNNAGVWKGVFYGADLRPNDNSQKLVNHLVSI